MRTIIISHLAPTDIGAAQLELWFRVPVPDNVTKPGRRTYYASLQSAYQPQAPPHTDPNIQAAEVAALQAGLYVERYGGIDRVDPTLTAAQLRARITNLFNDEVVKMTARDDTILSRYGTNLDDSTSQWTAGSA